MNCSTLRSEHKQKSLKNVTTILKEVHSPADVDNRKFDLIVSVMTFHHIGDVQAAISLLASLLKPSGKLFIFDLMKSDISNLFHSHHAHQHAGVHHMGGFTEEEMQVMFGKAGLKDVQAVEAFRHDKDTEEGTKQFAILLSMGTKE